MNNVSLSSKRYETADAFSAIELCYQQGWTDGLPVVPPTEKRVREFLDYVGMEPGHILGRVPERARTVTAEKVAINALMAGCTPEYLPVVLAVVEAICEEKFNAHGSSVSTGGSAHLVIANGPVRQKLSMNTGVNFFGPGNRANATIGRAVRLIAMNVLGSTPGVMDKSTIGHPGKYTYCVAENEEASPWEPLHVEKGFARESSTVTVINAEGPHQIYDHTNNTGEGILTSVAEYIAVCNYDYRELVVVLCPEHVGYLKAEGWNKQRVKAFLFQHAQRTVAYYKRTGKMPGPLDPSDEAKMQAALHGPEAVTVIVGGGGAGGFSAIIPTWGRGGISRTQTREIHLGKTA